MILFKSIKWKNFLSTGDVWTEIVFNDKTTTLIIGENGAGKSTVLDALTFALYGKPFRKINKPQLVNSVNEKDCRVEVEFTTNGKEYRVIRGMKPNIFQIFSEGVLINQDSSSVDYQSQFESTILGMGYKSFTQIVILGSAKFVPFMQLLPADRRAIIEDLLDIQIFSTMNVIVKQKLQFNKERTETTRLQETLKKDKRTVLENTIRGLKVSDADRRQIIEERIGSLGNEASDIKNQLNGIFFVLEGLKVKSQDISKIRDKHKKLVAMHSKLESNLHRHEHDISFYETNDVCTTCRQSIEPTFKASIVQSSNAKVSDLREGIDKINTEIGIVVNTIYEVDQLQNEINRCQNNREIKQNQLSRIESSIVESKNELSSLANNNSLLEDTERELLITQHDLKSLEVERAGLLDERQYLETALSLLKDGGIKSRIIKQYLPIINKYVNKYLMDMGFFVHFEMDENFTEVIRSRHRDIFSYQNFSEGEKMKIDMAIMLTWRAVAKLKNSVNTNLLILDEIFDSSLDNTSADSLMLILKSLAFDQGTNVFVISHRGDQLVDKFQNVVRFEKQKGFSRMIV